MKNTGKGKRLKKQTRLQMKNGAVCYVRDIRSAMKRRREDRVSCWGLPSHRKKVSVEVSH